MLGAAGMGWHRMGWDGMGQSPGVTPPGVSPRSTHGPSSPFKPHLCVSPFKQPIIPPPGLGAYLPAAGSLYKTLIKCLAVTYPGREIAFSRTSRKSDPQEAGGAPPTAPPAAHRDAGQGEGGTTRVPKARTCRLSPRHGPENQ